MAASSSPEVQKPTAHLTSRAAEEEPVVGPLVGGRIAATEDEQFLGRRAQLVSDPARERPPCTRTAAHDPGELRNPCAPA
jgi:hypothetical protein